MDEALVWLNIIVNITTFSCVILRGKTFLIFSEYITHFFSLSLISLIKHCSISFILLIVSGKYSTFVSGYRHVLYSLLHFT